MGLTCSCGAFTPIPLTADNITFDFSFVGTTTATGSATYIIDVCADRPELGSLSLVFIDQDNVEPDRSFTFTATEITDVTCQTDGDNCSVSIQGAGLVSGEVTPRNFFASVLVRPEPFPDLVTNFSINGFAFQTGVAPVPQEIVSFGCGEQ